IVEADAFGLKGASLAGVQRLDDEIDHRVADQTAAKHQDQRRRNALRRRAPAPRPSRAVNRQRQGGHRIAAQRRFDGLADAATTGISGGKMAARLAGLYRRRPSLYPAQIWQD